jgi:hypothetical protein
MRSGTTRHKKQITSILLFGAVSLISLAAYAATVIGSQVVSNPSYVFDGNTSTVATPGTGSPSYCPSGFVYNGGTCSHVSTGTTFKAYEVVGFYETYLCEGTINITHSQTAGSGPPAQTHVYYRLSTSSAWSYAGTVISSTSVTTSNLQFSVPFPNSSELQVALAKSTASLNPPTGPSLRWHELSLSASGFSCP